MQRLLLTVLTAFGLLLIACTAVPTATPTASAPAQPARPSVLRIELAAELDVPDIPRALAVQTLREQGYTIETLEFNDNAQSAQALEQGDLDFANISSGIAWSAIQQGAKSITILDDTTDSRVLITRSDIKECSDLDGKRVAVSSLTSTQALMVERYLARYCPGTKIEGVVMAGGGNRVAAVAAGQLEATAVTLDDWLAIQLENDPNMHALAFFSNEFPGLRGTSQIASRDMVSKYPETIKDFIRANLLARRKISDPQFFSDQIVKYLNKSPEEAKAIADAFLEHKVWDMNGGLTPENLQSNINFFVESGSLKPGLKPEDVANLSYLTDVLEEIGTK